MGSGMAQSCISLGSGRRMGLVVAGSTLIWSHKSREGGCLLAVVLGAGAGGTGVGKGKNWAAAVRDYAHRCTQVATVGNYNDGRVLDECNSPSLPMSGQVE